MRGKGWGWGGGAKSGVFILLLSLLVACSSPLKSDLPADQVYRLVPQVNTAPGKSNANLYLPRVEVSPALDTSRITLVKEQFQQDFIANSRWPDDLSGYLHAVMLDALSRSGAFQSVSDQLLGNGGNYKLLLRVSAFQAEYPPQGKGSVAVVLGMESILVRVQDQRVMGQHRYDIRKENVPVRTGKIVEAMNQALGETITALIADLEGDLGY
ncbi:MAG: membrane integrity-associated transporter subunit PqiC [Gammaproteobacteria bacterium]|nr:membrane integrity-associated transporter subunit PqiC [Gammaproteobacteria bacterium]MBU1722330.1 membrane integrity-associated transporter subunit PqiC [Gammaproteobacteria bacterium]MBU2004733.1 membrane integrity-associated transporter subunit PqiC [Gammaproteobacteria bacterium]